MTTTEDFGQSNKYSQFIQFIKKWLTNLAVNAELFVEIMEDDEMPLSTRGLAAGVLLYLKLPFDIIPDKLKALGLVDDVLVMVAGLSLIVSIIPEERLAYYRQKYEAVATIDKTEQLMADMLGMLWERLRQFVNTLRERRYKNKSAEDVAQSEDLREDMFDDTMQFVADLNLDPATLDEQFKNLPAPEKVIGLLADGMDNVKTDDSSSSSPRSALKRLFSYGG